MPAGVDEYSFQYNPEDVTKVADAQLVFMNGAGLKTFMEPLPKNTDEHAEGGDPHVWTDPENVKVWTQNIAAALAELDPEHTA